jgi:hypothetical protein
MIPPIIRLVKHVLAFLVLCLSAFGLCQPTPPVALNVIGLLSTSTTTVVNVEFVDQNGLTVPVAGNSATQLTITTAISLPQAMVGAAAVIPYQAVGAVVFVYSGTLTYNYGGTTNGGVGGTGVGFYATANEPIANSPYTWGTGSIVLFGTVPKNFAFPPEGAGSASNVTIVAPIPAGTNHIGSVTGTIALTGNADVSLQNAVTVSPSGSYTSANQSNIGWREAKFYLNISSLAVSQTVTLEILYVEPTSGQTAVIYVTSALVSTGKYVVDYGPGCSQTGTIGGTVYASAAGILPKTFKVVLVYGDNTGTLAVTQTLAYSGVN